jgi:ABC-2 type transport system permease protein
MLQYRGAAVAGLITQCWWGGVKVMVLAAFFGASAAAAHAPISLAQAITYTWIAQACLSLLPWTGDPDVAIAVRTGAVSYDRLRPVDPYTLWYARSAGWIATRLLPRAALMLLFAGFALPLMGFAAWSWRPPASLAAGLLFGLSIGLALLLSAAIVMLINIAVLALLNDRGTNALAAPLGVAFSGNLLPLALFPDWMRAALLIQPFAGLLDIPLRIYVGDFVADRATVGVSLQLFWIAALIALGRCLMTRTMRTLEVQGG